MLVLSTLTTNSSSGNTNMLFGFVHIVKQITSNHCQVLEQYIATSTTLRASPGDTWVMLPKIYHFYICLPFCQSYKRSYYALVTSSKRK